MSCRDIAEALRRDDLWLDAEAGRFTLLDTVAPSRHPSRDPEVLLVELEDGLLVQALALCSRTELDLGDVLMGLVPLSFGPVQEGAR